MWCGAMEEITGSEEETTKIEMVEEVFKSCFPNWVVSNLYILKSLRMFSSKNHELEFPSLDKLVIKRCHTTTKFFSLRLSAPKLKEALLDHQCLDIPNFLFASASTLKEVPLDHQCPDISNFLYAGASSWFPFCIVIAVLLYTVDSIRFSIVDAIWEPYLRFSCHINQWKILFCSLWIEKQFHLPCFYHQI